MDLEEHYGRVIPRLADMLSLCTKASLFEKLKRWTRPERSPTTERPDDPQASELLYSYARQIIEADPGNREVLTQLVPQRRGGTGIAKSLGLGVILLHGLIGSPNVGLWSGAMGVRETGKRRKRGRPATTDPQADANFVKDLRASGLR